MSNSLSLDDLPNETWVDIKGYEGFYKVSDYGRVKSLYYNNSNFQKILKQKLSKQGYYLVGLSKNSIVRWFRVNRLVGEVLTPDKTTFKSMPDENRDEINLDKLEINHKDENKLNNHVSNLEWCTSKYNCNYGTRMNRIGLSQRVKINQYSLDGKYLKTWDSISELQRNKYNGSHISDVCNGYRQSANGYLWKKYDGNTNNIKPYAPKTVNQFTKELIYHA